MNSYKQLSTTIFVRQPDGASIPTYPDNPDYQQYLADKAAGATVIPMDIPSPNIAILAQIAQIETTTAVPRIVREALMRQQERNANADAAATNTTAAVILAANAGYQRVKVVDDQVHALRSQLK